MTSMNGPAALRSGKGERDENFPVGSFLIRKKHRPTVLAFYRFARTADDVADHPHATVPEKLRLLEKMRRSLEGEIDESPEATALRSLLADKQLPAQHGLDLLEAFRRDVTTLRYADWGELIDYCRFSAMPVGRFVLDVHGESRASWPASDALCAALQVINHLQDCARDFRELDRVYIPLDLLHGQGIEPSALAGERSSPALRNVFGELIAHVSSLLAESLPFARQIADRRLALEVSVIQRLAEDLTRRLQVRDPLSQRVHHRAVEYAGIALKAAAAFAVARPRNHFSAQAPRHASGSPDGN